MSQGVGHVHVAVFHAPTPTRPHGFGSSVAAGKGQSDLKRKKALRAKYDGMDVARLKEAARDNLRRALLMR